MVPVKFKRFTDRARVPTYASELASGADVYIAHVNGYDERAKCVHFWPGETVVVWTDIGIELPPGTEAQVRPRSGGSKAGILVHLGTIDNDYRGNIGVTITNLSRDPMPLELGDRIAQLVVAPVLRADFSEAFYLTETARGGSGYGSTGVK